MIDHAVHRTSTAQKPAARHRNATLYQCLLRDRAEPPVEFSIPNHGRHRSRSCDEEIPVGTARLDQCHAHSRIFRQPRGQYAACRAATHDDEVEALRFAHGDATGRPSKRKASTLMKDVIGPPMVHLTARFLVPFSYKTVRCKGASTMRISETFTAQQRHVPLTGTFDPNYARVVEAFMANYREEDEVGSGLHIVRDGESVVDIWGGWRDGDRTREWQRDTLVCVMSVSKGIAALAFNMLIDRGWSMSIRRWRTTGRSSPQMANSVCRSATCSTIARDCPSSPIRSGQARSSIARPWSRLSRLRRRCGSREPRRPIR